MRTNARPMACPDATTHFRAAPLPERPKAASGRALEGHPPHFSEQMP
jgi:hypothetical protein